MLCPFCQEEIKATAVKCKHCGEFLDGSGPPPSGGGSTGRTVLIVGAVCLVLFCLCVPILATLLMPVLMKAKEKANRTKCSNNMRQLGLAAIQYADDKRYFPHVSSMKTLDGGPDTNHSTKKTRTLLYYAYHDNPEGFICPSSFDISIPSPGLDGRTWFWDGGSNPTDGSQSPLVDGAPDPSLEETTELSYGWSRRGFTYNVSSSPPLLADRAVREDSDDSLSLDNAMIGNHTDGWNVLKTDSSVNWLSVGAQPYPGSTLTATGSPTDGYLDLKAQTDAAALGQ